VQDPFSDLAERYNLSRRCYAVTIIDPSPKMLAEAPPKTRP
jgi:hypothetical protein